MTIVARNWRRPAGEIDLVAATSDRSCVFVEVRSRTGVEMGDPLETVDLRKQARVIRAARLFMDEEPLAGYQAFRFDVVGVTFHEDGRPPTCVHIEDAFRAE